MKTARFPDGTYPDRDCNLETFTNEKFLELETLGPMVHLPPGRSAEHTEFWSLNKNVELPAEDDALFGTLSDYAAKLTGRATA